MALNTHNIIYAGLYIQKQKKCLILPSFQLYEYVRKEKSECVSHQAPREHYILAGFVPLSITICLPSKITEI